MKWSASPDEPALSGTEPPGFRRSAAILAVFLAPVLHHLRYGYRFGYSDQDEFLPWLLSRLDHTLFRTDWLVGLQSGSFNVRRGIVGVLQPLASWSSVETAVLVVHLLAWVLLSYSVFRLALIISGRSSAALLASIVILVLIPRWTLGGNAMASPMLVPTLLAWAVAVPALVLYLSKRPVLAGLLIASAAWVQFLVAFHVGMAIVVAAVVSAERDWSRPARFAAAAVIPSLALVYLLASADKAVDVLSSEPTSFAVMGYFRAPHHYVAGAFPILDWLRTGFLFATGSLALVHLGRKRDGIPIRFAFGILLSAIIAAAIGWWFSMQQPNVTVATLQPFKQTVLAGLVLVSAIAGFLVKLLPRAVHAIERRLFHPASVAVCACVAVFLVTRIPIVTLPDESLPQAATWARGNTAPDALFAVPPSTSGFSYAARRSVLVTFKAMAFREADMRAWYRRLSDVAPGATSVPDRFDPDLRIGVGPLLARLDSAFEALDEPRLVELADRYGAGYVVRRTALVTGTDRVTLSATFDGLRVYYVRPRERSRVDETAPVDTLSPGSDAAVRAVGKPTDRP